MAHGHLPLSNVNEMMGIDSLNFPLNINESCLYSNSSDDHRTWMQNDSFNLIVLKYNYSKLSSFDICHRVDYYRFT